jgi:hypothetical protein
LQNLNFSMAQQSLVDNILSGLSDNTIDSFDNYFDNVDEQIVQADMPDTDKMVFYLASAMARGSYDYWSIQANTLPPGGPWSAYFTAVYSTSVSSYVNIPYWVAATFVGCLSGFSQLQMPNMGAATYLNDEGIVYAQLAALVGAIGLTSGKVIFKWAKRPATPCSCTTSVVVDTGTA